jgi:hypothetical protein
MLLPLIMLSNYSYDTAFKVVNIYLLFLFLVRLTKQGTKREYQVPKSHVEGFNGSEVFLDLSFNEVLKSYKVA